MGDPVIPPAAPPGSVDDAAGLLKGGMAAVATSVEELDKVAADREARLGRVAMILAAAGVALLVLARRLATQRHRLRQSLP